MSLFRVIFKFERKDYSDELRLRMNESIMHKIKTTLAQKNIQYTTLLSPTRNSLKAIFPSEQEVNKIFDNINIFLKAGFKPLISLSLKAQRTIFCTKFDTALIETYNKTDIIEFLKIGGWEVANVYITKNNKSMKIEFNTIANSTKFLNEDKTRLGGIFLYAHNKEREVDPFIPQCWQCGEINPGHMSRHCVKPQVCLRCGERGHKFFECNIPKNLDEMSIQDKQMRYCIPCGSRGDHTTLDHTACPKQREIVRKRVKEARENAKQQEILNQRDRNLIKSVLNFQNTETWPKISYNPLNTKMSALLSLTLIEEAINPGCFEEKLSSSCEINGITPIKYTLEPNTAKIFFETLTGNPGQDINREIPQSHDSNAQHTNTESTGAKPKQLGEKFVRDLTGGKNSLYHTLNLEEAISQVDRLGKIEKDRPPKRQPTPYKINVNTRYTQLSKPRGEETSELREASSSQSEAIGPYKEFEDSLKALEWSPDEVHCNYCNKKFHGEGTNFYKHVENCSEIYHRLSRWGKDKELMEKVLKINSQYVL